MNTSKRMYQMLAASSDGLPAIQIAAFDQINKETFNLRLTTPHSDNRYTQNDYNEALASITENKFQLVSDSLFRNQDGSLRCIAFTNFVTKPADEKTVSSMNRLNANVLEDDRGEMWRMIGEGDNRQLVQVAQEDYAALLQRRRQLTQMTASEDYGTADVPYEDLDFVYFANPELQAMDFGFIVKTADQDFVVSRSMKGALTIKASQVMEAASTAGSPMQLRTRRQEFTRKNALQEFVNYLKELYGTNNEYIQAWMRGIRSSSMRVA